MLFFPTPSLPHGIIDGPVVVGTFSQSRSLNATSLWFALSNGIMRVNRSTVRSRTRPQGSGFFLHFCPQHVLSPSVGLGLFLSTPNDVHPLDYVGRAQTFLRCTAPRTRWCAWSARLSLVVSCISAAWLRPTLAPRTQQAWPIKGSARRPDAAR